MNEVERITLRSQLSAYFRRRRAETLRNLIDELAMPRRELHILDVGGRIQYWNYIGLSFLRERNITITLLNLHRSEFPQTELDKIFNLAIGNACSLNYRDQSFDLVHSNSVIEHVGSTKEMQDFSGEIRRVARSYYVQTPYFWFPIDPHFYAMPMFHWFPRPIKAHLLRTFPLAASGRVKNYYDALRAVDSCRLLDLNQFRFLFPDSKIVIERFSGLPKSLVGIRK